MYVPFSKVDILNFKGFLLKRGWRGATIQSYMSSVRAVHIYKGYNFPALKDGVVEAVIGRAKNRELGEVRGVRLAMTPKLMSEFKTSLKDKKMWQLDKRLIWAVATFAFWGS